MGYAPRWWGSHTGESHMGYMLQDGGYIPTGFINCYWILKIILITVPQIKHIREKKLLHHQALELVKRLCTEVVKSNILRAPQIFVTPLHQAISFGIREIVEEILKSDPNAKSLSSSSPIGESSTSSAVVLGFLSALGFKLGEWF